MQPAAIIHASKHSIQPVITVNRSRLGTIFSLIHKIVRNCVELLYVESQFVHNVPFENWFQSSSLHWLSMKYDAWI